MKFGKYKGRDLADVPDSYLRWLTSIELREPLKSHVQREVRRRSVPVAADAIPAHLRDVAIEIISRGYRAVSRDRHPDAGGTHEGMVTATAARDALRALVEGTP
jgi:hypothetical protein